MACDDASPGMFAVVVHLPPGCVPILCFALVDIQWSQSSLGVRLCIAPCRYHQYKFIVDGEWRHDETQPFMPDPLGNVNNWLFVRRPEQTQNQG